MPMILIEASEARENTLLPQSVIDAGRVVVGLETLTGADLVISPLSEPKPPTTLRDCAPHRRILRRHTEAGVLVQRKSGTDLVNSLSDLAAIEQRMLEWSGGVGPYLLATGTWSASRNGRALLDGHPTPGACAYKALVAALDWWQVRGGNVSLLATDSQVGAWVAHWHEQVLPQLGAHPERTVFPPAQTLSADDPWWMRLAAVGGIGPVRAKAIAEWLPDEWQSLAHALYCLTDLENLNLPGKPVGVGPKTVRAVREWLGIEYDEIITVRKWKE